MVKLTGTLIEPGTIAGTKAWGSPRRSVMSSVTGPVNRLSGLAEVGLDYTARLASFLELGIYVRKYWGLGHTLRSDLVYKVNCTTEEPASITANGSGLSLHYMYGRRHELKKTDVCVP